MFWSSKNYKHWFIKKNLKRNVLISEQVNNISPWIKKYLGLTLNRKSQINFAFNKNTLLFRKIYFINLLLNFFGLIISGFSFLVISYGIIDNLLWKEYNLPFENLGLILVISLLLIILFMIRFQSDFLRSCLRGNLVKTLKKKFLIIDILTLNFISLLGNFYIEEIFDYLNSEKIHISKNKIKEYQKYSNWWVKLSLLWFVLVILIFCLWVWLFTFINFNGTSESLKIAEKIILLLTFLSCPYWVFTYIPSLVISNILIKKIFNNSETQELPVLLSLLRYIGCAGDFDLVSFFIAEFDLHDQMLAKNYYQQI